MLWTDSTIVRLSVSSTQGREANRGEILQDGSARFLKRGNDLGTVSAQSRNGILEQEEAESTEVVTPLRSLCGLLSEKQEQRERNVSVRREVHRPRRERLVAVLTGLGATGFEPSPPNQGVGSLLVSGIDVPWVESTSPGSFSQP